ncbi:MAG: response regulator [Acetobacteraceae bacterium]|nr:response regulator [Acetobacteraceae bacterium]
MKRSSSTPFAVSLGATPVRPKVLVVEDNDFIMKIYKAILQKAGCRLIEARTTTEAQIVLKHERPDLIIMDQKLPDGSGIDATRLIRDHADLKNTPVIVVTDGSAASDEQARAVGCSACISKPIRVSAFGQLVRHHLDARPKSGSPADVCQVW